MKQGFSYLGDLLKAGLQRVGLQLAVREKTAALVWEEVVGEKTAAATSVESVREGIVYVTCRDSLWAQQLHFLRPVIIQKLNERLGANAVREIRLSGRGFGRERQREEERSPTAKEELPALTEQDAAEIERAARRIADAELAHRVRRGLRASRALRRERD